MTDRLEALYTQLENEYTREELFEMYCEEGGNNGQAVMLNEAVDVEEYCDWLEGLVEWCQPDFATQCAQMNADAFYSNDYNEV